MMGDEKKRSLKDLFLEAWREYERDNALQFAAAVAFFSILSLAPLLVLAVGLSGALLGDEAVRGEIAAEVGQFVGEEGAEAIQSLIRNASEGDGGAFASIVGFLALAWGASRIFQQLRIALNEILNIEPTENGGAWAWIRQRVIAILGVFTVGAAILISVLLNTIVSRVQSAVELPGGRLLWQTLSLTLSLVILGAIVTLIFRYIPDVRTPWPIAFLGALVSTSLFAIGQVAIMLYFTFSDVGSSFGASSSLIVLILWIFYSTSILFFGAEVMQVRAGRETWNGDGAATDRPAFSDPRVTPAPSARSSSIDSSRSKQGVKLAAAAGAGGCLGIFAGLLTALAATLAFIVRNARKIFGR